MAGALDLLIVILAVSVLGLSHAWVGYLNFVYGVGAVLAATLSVVLIGRRLGVPILAAALLLSIAIAALAFDVGLAVTVALLVVAGASHTLLDVSNRILLQRSVPAQLIGQVFGILEGLQGRLGAGRAPRAAAGVPGRQPVRPAGRRGRAAAGRRARRPRVVQPGRRGSGAGGRDRALAFATPVRRTSTDAIEALPRRSRRRTPPGTCSSPRPTPEMPTTPSPPVSLMSGRTGASPAVRARRRHRGNRAAALDPAHGDRHRALRRDRVPAQPGALPDRGARPCPYPPRGPPHRQRAARGRRPA